jgi:tetratricopeptide (TPR) repeat protein
MRKRFALVAVVCASAGSARADLAAGREKYAKGEYKAAIAELAKVTGKDKTAAKLLVARAQIATGDYAAADATLQPFAKDAAAIDARLLLDDLRRATGHRAEAVADLEQLHKQFPDDRAVRTALGEARAAYGDPLGAKALFDVTIKEFDAKKLDLDRHEQLFMLAAAARSTSQYQLANDSFRAAMKPPTDSTASPGEKQSWIDFQPVLGDVGVQWADLFSQKYAAELAAETLEEVFKQNPNHPDAHAAMASVLVETTYDLAQIRHHLEQALAVNPKSARALKVRASLEIDQNQWDVALKTIGEVLAINPEDVEALALKATIAWLRDDMKGYDALRAQAFAVDAKFAELYRIVARSAVREHRYVEAIELEKQAIKLKPDFYEAMAGAGLGYLRMGMEKEGLEWLDKASRGDPYNVRTINTLNLYDRMPREYTFQATKNFRIRYHNEERAAIARYVEPTMERAFADMVRRYGFTPTQVTLELYADKTDYAVRTVGLPDLGALGVCFGKVITAMSPANGDINWGMVLWHELGHVFAIQLSNSRVPRWFTEGLSEYETLLARPDWRRENDADLYGSYSNGTMPSIANLNASFISSDSGEVIAAYFQSAVTIEYLAQTYGFPKIVEALKLYGKGQETPEVLKAITGKTIAELDADFRAYLDVRLAAYKGTFKLPSKGFDDVTKLEIAADAAPKDATKRAHVALGYYYAGDADKAGSAAKAALALDPKQPIARYITAEIAWHLKDGPKAKQLYAELIADGHDSYDIRTRLAELAMQEGDVGEWQKQLCAAKKLDPERSYPYQALAQHYKKQGKVAEELAELEHYAFLEQMELAPLKELVAGYSKAGNWAKVKTYGEMATFIQPQDIDILIGLGRAYVELGDGARALYTYDTALVVNPPPRRPALVHLGRAKALWVMKKKAEAKAALATAKQTEPENAEILELEGKIR